MQRSEAGFTLLDLLVTMAVAAVLAGMAIPEMTDLVSQMRLGQGARDVERELQTARLKSVTSGRPMRVRFNCPAAREYRMTELIGTPSVPAAGDTAANRCSATAYPYPAGDLDPLTRPNNDGPVRDLPKDVSFGTVKTLEFWPDGTVHMDDGSGTLPWPVVAPSGTDISLTKDSSVKHITVNGIGKITLVE